MTPKKKIKPKRSHMIKNKGEKKQCISEGLTNIVCNIRNIVFRTPTFGFVCPAEYKNELGQRLRIHQRSCGQSSWRRRCRQRLL